MRVLIEFVMLFEAVRWSSVSARVTPSWVNSLNERCARSPSRSLCPSCTSAEMLRPRLAKRCRSVRRSERLSPSVWLWVSLLLAFSTEPNVLVLAASPRLPLRLFWK